MGKYQLQTPITTRRNGETVELTELDMPDVVTVGMIAKSFEESNMQAAAIRMVGGAAGLNVVECEKLEWSDASAYIAEMNMGDDDLGGLVLPEIKPLLSTYRRITANVQTHANLYAYQGALAIGVTKDVLDAMPANAFLNVLAHQIVQGLLEPKKG